MRAGVACLIALLVAGPASAQSQESPQDDSRGRLFWSGLAIAAAGVTAAVLGVTVYRVDDNSTGNAPPNAYQTCVAQRVDPIYATNNCDALKAKNRPLLWSGVAAGALGGVLMIRSAGMRAEISTNGFRISHTMKF